MPLRFQMDRPRRLLRITTATRTWEVKRRHWVPFSACSWVISILVWVALVLIFCRVKQEASSPHVAGK